MRERVVGVLSLCGTELQSGSECMKRAALKSYYFPLQRTELKEAGQLVFFLSERNQHNFCIIMIQMLPPESQGECEIM